MSKKKSKSQKEDDVYTLGIIISTALALVVMLIFGPLEGFVIFFGMMIITLLIIINSNL